MSQPDLGFASAEQERIKANLTLQICRSLKARGLTQAGAGAILGVKQPQVSNLMRGRSGSFSVGKLLEFLTALGQDVEITVRPAHKEQGGMSVTLGRTSSAANDFLEPGTSLLRNRVS